MGGVILTPTDTVWGLSCNAQNDSAIEKIYNLKHRPAAKALIVLLWPNCKLEQFCDSTLDAMTGYLNTGRPTTVIFPGAKNISAQATANDGTVAIRVVQQGFIKHLLEVYKKPLISTSANISGEKSPTSLRAISEQIKSGCDYIVPEIFAAKIESTQSRIIKLLPNGGYETIRE